MNGEYNARRRTAVKIHQERVFLSKSIQMLVTNPLSIAEIGNRSYFAVLGIEARTFIPYTVLSPFHFSF